MKKGWKIFTIVCGSLAGLGVILCCISFALGFTLSDLPRYSSFVNWVRHYDDDYRDSDDDDYRNTSNRNFNGKNGEFSNITELDIDVTQVTVEVQKYEGNTIKVESDNVDSRLKLRFYQDGNELIVKTTEKFRPASGHSGVIRILLPQNVSFTEADFSIGAGELLIDDIKATSLQMDVGAGRAEVKSFTANELSADCGAGELILTGQTNREVDIECGVGNVNYNTTGSEADYNYDIKCGIGNVTVGGGSYSGIASDKRVENGAGKEMSIDCGLGNVEVTFNNN